MSVSIHEINKNKKDDILSFVSKAYDEGKARMQTYYRQWALQLAWVRGHQNTDIDPVTKKWKRPTKDSWRSRLISNLMLPVVRRNVSRLVHPNLTWEVLPATPDETDIEIAGVSTKVAQDAWIRTNMLKNLIRIAFWQSTAANAFLKVGWDVELGDDVRIRTRNLEKETLEKFLEFLGLETIPEEVQLRTGEVYVDPISPFNILCDPLASVFEDSDWILETQIRSKDWIIEKFGNKWKDKINESESSEIFIYPYVYNENTALPPKGVITQELYIRKTAKFPNGQYCFIADGQLIDKPRENPFSHGQLPYVHFLEIYDPASLWGTCAAEQIRSDQAQYNKTKSSITDHISQMGKLQWLNPFNSRAEFTNRPGGIINYKPPYKPEQTTLKPLPSYTERALERTRRDIQDVGSDHNVSHGQNEPGLRSGKAIIALQDADDAVLNATLIWFNDGVAKTGKLVLQTISQFVTEQRVIHVVGEFNEQETLTFMGSDLVGGTSADYFQVRVKAAPFQAMSRLARQQQVVQLIELSVLNPANPKDKDVIIGAIGFGDTMSYFDEFAAEKTRQWKEIETMIGGQQVNVIQYEDHETHLKMIRKFIASGKRNKVSPEALQLILKHATDHEEMQALELQRKASYYQLTEALTEQGQASKRNNGQAVNRVSRREDFD